MSSVKSISVEQNDVMLPQLDTVERVGELAKIQSYNPIYKDFFPLNESNYNQVCFRQKQYIADADHVIDHDTKIRQPCSMFIKSAPLIDPIHYLIGKYKKENKKWLELPQLNSTEEQCMAKLLDANNTSYVDTFFNFLSSNVKQEFDIPHGIGFYGSFLGVQKKFVFNAYDDIEYLQESDYFLENAGAMYHVEKNELKGDTDWPSPTNQNTKQNRPKLCFDEDAVEDDIVLDVEQVSTVENENREKSECITTGDFAEVTTVYESTDAKHDDNSDVSDDSDDNSDKDDDSETSSINYSTDEDNEDNEEDGDGEKSGSDGDESDYSTVNSDEDGDDDGNSDDGSNEDEDEFLPLYIYDFPVQMIALEKCTGTMDDLLEKEELEENQILAALLQVMFTLIVYQKMFWFTHNDLHTNNIVYQKTETKYLYYQLERKVYKVPTYGRIFKIIDFGRSIYRFQDKLFCSDSFGPTGDANGQYNTEPYFNPKKPRLEPNKSFDLCRLGCSLYSFFFDPDEPLPKEMTTLQQLVLSWCMDDNKMNILYKRNGEERYPNFKLYKMIARLVHDKSPEEQLKHSAFNEYLMKPKAKAKLSKEERIIHIDELPVLWTR